MKKMLNTVPELQDLCKMMLKTIDQLNSTLKRRDEFIASLLNQLMEADEGEEWKRG